MTSAPLRKCTRRFEPPHGGTAARPPPLLPPPLRPHSALAARPLSPAAATCDTLSRVTPFRGARRASACLPSSGRSFYHHPAPPRPSVKRATSPLPPVDRPPFPFLTSLPPPLRLPSFQIIMSQIGGGGHGFETDDAMGADNDADLKLFVRRKDREGPLLSRQRVSSRWVAFGCTPPRPERGAGSRYVVFHCSAGDCLSRCAPTLSDSLSHH